MAPEPVVPVAQQPPTPPAEQMTNEQIIQALQTGGPPADPAVIPPPDALEVKLSTGQVYKGSPQEVIAQLQKAQEHATTTIRDREQQIRELRTAPPPSPQVQQTSPGNEAGWDRAEYFRLWEEDPLVAQNYLDAHRLHLEKPEDVPGYFQTSYDRSEVFQNLFETAQFHQRVADFPGGDEAAEALMGQMKSRPWTAENLELSYHELVRSGKLTAAPPVSATAPASAGAPPIPPSAPAGGGAPPNIIENIERLSDKEMEDVLRKSGYLQ